MTDAYQNFLATKVQRATPRGLDVVAPLAPHLFDFQRACVEFLLRCGSGGLYLDTGLGKTACELEWCRHASPDGMSLILTPLAVARQIEREGLRWGYDCRVIRSQSDATDGINICNYDRLHLLDCESFDAVVLDEASILKSFTGATQRALTSSFAGHRWKMAATATPAPNDHMELGQQAEFLGVMPSNEMLMRWFIADQSEMGAYRLKRHAVSSFWDWMASWSRMAQHPRDLGHDMPGFDLPPIEIHRYESDDVHLDGIGLFCDASSMSATTIHRVKRQTSGVRADVAARIADECDGPVVIWCDTNYEADELVKRIPSAGEVRGSQSLESKEDTLAAFADGSLRVIVSKPRICGFGLNWQHCSDMIFVGRSFSYESYYQAVRRCWRFGQQKAVNVHLVLASGEDHIGRAIDRKAGDHSSMKIEMVGAMRRAMNATADRLVAYQPDHAAEIPTWLK